MKHVFPILVGLAALFVLVSCIGKSPGADPASSPPDGPEPVQASSGGTASLTFDSFDGGGPSYSVAVEDPSVVSCTRGEAYDDPDHEAMDGAGYTVTFVFSGLRPGETYVTVAERSSVGGNYDHRYAVTVDGELQVTVTHLYTEDLEALVTPRASLVLEVNGKTFYPDWEENSSAAAFLEKLKEGSLALQLHDYGGFEKVGPLPWELPRNDERITAEPGDIILYQGDQLTIYYDENTWEFTRLGRIRGMSAEEWLDVLGDGGVTVEFWLEWDE